MGKGLNRSDSKVYPWSGIRISKHSSIMLSPLIRGTATALDTASETIHMEARPREEEAWYERSLWDDVMTHK